MACRRPKLIFAGMCVQIFTWVHLGGWKWLGTIFDFFAAVVRSVLLFQTQIITNQSILAEISKSYQHRTDGKQPWTKLVNSLASVLTNCRKAASGLAHWPSAYYWIWITFKHKRWPIWGSPLTLTPSTRYVFTGLAEHFDEIISWASITVDDSRGVRACVWVRCLRGRFHLS